MKSTEFLIEDIAPDLEQFMQKIKQDCQPFLSQVDEPLTNDALYRGLGKSTQAFVHKTARLDNRIPSDMPENIHDGLNRFFTKEYGAPFRNGIFATGDRQFATAYSKGPGRAYIIFPIGDFKFLWSPQVRDLYNEIEFWRHDRGIPGKGREPMDDYHLLALFKHLKGKNYKTTAINAAIGSSAEVMIYCKEYYALHIQHLPVDRDEQAYLQEILKK